MKKKGKKLSIFAQQNLNPFKVNQKYSFVDPDKGVHRSKKCQVFCAAQGDTMRKSIVLLNILNNVSYCFILSLLK